MVRILMIVFTLAVAFVVFVGIGAAKLINIASSSSQVESSTNQTATPTTVPTATPVPPVFPDPREIILRLEDLPTGFTLSKEEELANEPEKQRLGGLSVTYENADGPLDGAAAYFATVHLYETAEAAAAGHQRFIDDNKSKQVSAPSLGEQSFAIVFTFSEEGADLVFKGYSVGFQINNLRGLVGITGDGNQISVEDAVALAKIQEERMLAALSGEQPPQADRMSFAERLAARKAEVAAAQVDPFMLEPKEDGTYVVGSAIAPGVWHSEDTDLFCYWASLDDDGDEISSGVVSDDESLTVTVLKTDYAFEAQGCGTFTYIGPNSRNVTPEENLFVVEPKGHGYFVVGSAIAPGVWYSEDVDLFCYWARLDDDGDEISSGVVNDNSLTVTIQPTDYAFLAQGCGTLEYKGPVSGESTSEVDSFAAEPKGSGNFVVGSAIAPGIWYSEEVDLFCYWARLDDDGDEIQSGVASSDTSLTVTLLETDYAFEAQGCGTFEYKGPVTQRGTPEENPFLIEPKGNGNFVVGAAIAPGIWYSEEVDLFCYWSRLDADGDEIDSGVIGGDDPVTVTIFDSDYAFQAQGCGTFEYQGPVR